MCIYIYIYLYRYIICCIDVYIGGRRLFRSYDGRPSDPPETSQATRLSPSLLSLGSLLQLPISQRRCWYREQRGELKDRFPCAVFRVTVREPSPSCVLCSPQRDLAN